MKLNALYFVILLTLVLLPSCKTTKKIAEKKDVTTVLSSKIDSITVNEDKSIVDSIVTKQILETLNVEQTTIEEGKWFDDSGTILFEGKKTISTNITNDKSVQDSTSLFSETLKSNSEKLNAQSDSTSTDNSTYTETKKTSATTFTFFLGSVLSSLLMLIILFLIRRAKLRARP